MTMESNTNGKPPLSVNSIGNNSTGSSAQRSRTERDRYYGKHKSIRRYKAHESQLMIDAAVGRTITKVKGALFFFCALLVHSIIYFRNYERRSLSLNLGGGDCLYQPPVQNVPANIDFFKTLLVGYPSGDKRFVFMQMEALTGWAAKDEWDFASSGDSNHPFIKANYPHHEGIWGWGKNADQVVMVVKNMRTSIVEYHDILWDIGYAQTWAEATLKEDNLYEQRPPIEAFEEWRDKRIVDEVQWYGWHIDYWMEGGLLRDVFTHKITTREHFNMLRQPHNFNRNELNYDRVVGPDTVVTPTYDTHCADGDVSGGCKPIAVISVENLLDPTEGPRETTLIADVLKTSPKMSKFILHQDAWNCIWNALIVEKQGAKTVVDRPKGEYAEKDHNFSPYVLIEMLRELDRMIQKYSSSDWNHLATANRLVELFRGHRKMIQAEFDIVSSSGRQLSAQDDVGLENTAEEISLNPAISEGTNNLRKANTDSFDTVLE